MGQQTARKLLVHALRSRQVFALWHPLLARRKDHFQKKICPQRTFPSDFVKFNWAEKYFIYFWRKNGRLFVYLLQLCPILAYFKKKTEAVIELRKLLFRN